jgi:hypothetical protein
MYMHACILTNNDSLAVHHALVVHAVLQDVIIAYGETGRKEFECCRKGRLILLFFLGKRYQVLEESLSSKQTN